MSVAGELLCAQFQQKMFDSKKPFGLPSQILVSIILNKAHSLYTLIKYSGALKSQGLLHIFLGLHRCEGRLFPFPAFCPVLSPLDSIVLGPFPLKPALFLFPLLS